MSANPYFIEGPACISFSGGRTSALMLERIVELRQRVEDSPALVLDDIEEDAADSECGGWCDPTKGDRLE